MRLKSQRPPKKLPSKRSRPNRARPNLATIVDAIGTIGGVVKTNATTFVMSRATKASTADSVPAYSKATSQHVALRPAVMNQKRPRQTVLAAAVVVVVPVAAVGAATAKRSPNHKANRISIGN